MARVIKSAADFAATMRSIQKRLDDIPKNVKVTTTQAVADITLDGLGRSVERAPVETGDLRGSGYAEVNQSVVARGKQDNSGGIDVVGAPGESSGNVVESKIGFTAPHAFTQHEHTEYNHPRGGQAKYLQSVVVERMKAWINHLVTAGKNGLRGGD